MSGVGSVASSIEIVSNAVFVSGLNIRHSGHLLIDGRFPTGSLNSVIHETIHWETYTTPVGDCLAHAFLRSWLHLQLHSGDREVEKQSQTVDHRYEAIFNFTRYQVLSEILRPLAEGMALFAEFDMVPGDSAVTTSITRLLARQALSTVDDFPEAFRISDIARTVLQAIRTTTECVARKENLICQEFHTRRGGYLPGYLLVKGLRNYLVFKRGLTALLDGDLFFFCIKTIFFGDLSFSSLVVDPKADFYPNPGQDGVSNPRDVVNLMIKRFQELQDFAFHDLDQKFIDRLEAEITNGTQWSWTSLQTSSEGSEVSLIADQLQSLLENPDFGAAGEISELSELVLSNRRLLCLASYSAYIRINSHGRCLVYTDSSMTPESIVSATPAIKGSIEGAGEGSLEVYLVEQSGTFGRIVGVAHLGGKCVATFGIGERSSEGSILVPEVELGVVPSFLTVSELQGLMANQLEELSADDPLSEHYLSQTEGITQQLYEHYGKELYNNVIGGDFHRLFRAASLIELIDDEACKFLSLSVRVSLACSGVCTHDVLESLLTDEGVELSDFLAGLKRTKDLFGVPIASTTGQVWWFNF